MAGGPSRCQRRGAVLARDADVARRATPGRFVRMPVRPSDPTMTPRRARLLWAAAALLVAAHAILAWQARVPSVTTGNDDALYLLLARSLRAFHYRDVWDVAAPPHSQYPPLYPALLAVAGVLSGDRLDAALALNVALSSGALLLFFDAARRVAPWPAILALAAAALNPWLLRSAGSIASEPLFLFCTAVALRLAMPAAPRDIGSGVAAIASALARSAGITLVAALGIHRMLERRWRDAALLALGAALTVGPWLAWTMVAPGKLAGRSYVADAVFDPARGAPLPPGVTTGAGPAAESGPPVRVPPADSLTAEDAEARPVVRGAKRPSIAGLLAARVAYNVPAYLGRRLPSVLALPTRAGTTLDNIAWLVVTVLCGGLGLWLLWRRWRVAALWLCLYALLLLVWPYALGRFLLPILPWMLLAMAAGAGALGARWGHWLGIALSIVLIAPALGGSLARDIARASDAAACDRDDPLTSPGCFGASERAFFAAVRFTRDSLPRDAVILTAKEGTFHYYTGRRTAQLLGAVELEAPALARYLEERRARYILLSHLKLDAWALRAPVIELCPRLRVVRAWEPATLLLRLETPAAPDSSATSSCAAAVERWAAAPW